MFLILAISIAVIGLLILIALIAFSPTQVRNSLYENETASDLESAGEEPYESNDNYKKLDNYQLSNDNSGMNYLPVLDKKLSVKGLEKELVHFEGNGIFYQVESEKDVSEIDSHDIQDNKEIEEIKGKVYLTSKWIIMVNKQTKKIALRAIEEYKFINGFFLIKRKRVKKKKDVFKIEKDPAEFYYITKVLLER